MVDGNGRFPPSFSGSRAPAATPIAVRQQTTPLLPFSFHWYDPGEVVFMMEVNSTAEVLSVEDGAIQIAFDLTGSEPEYLIISAPEAGADANDDFFGHSHYVELKDQKFGHYGGLAGISTPRVNRVELSLAFEVPNVGTELAINTREPMSPAILSRLQRLQTT